MRSLLQVARPEVLPLWDGTRKTLARHDSACPGVPACFMLTARKFAYQFAEDPDLVWKKATNRIKKFIAYKWMHAKVDAGFQAFSR